MKECLVCENPDYTKDQISFDDRKRQLEEEQNKREHERKDSPYTRWTQFNLKHTEKMMWLTLKHPKAQAILFFLVDQADNYNAVVVSNETLAKALKISVPTVCRNTKVLKENGYIAILRTGGSNVYVINDRIFWKSWNENMKYCKFPANVVLAEHEQDKETQLEIKDLGYTTLKVVEPKEK